MNDLVGNQVFRGEWLEEIPLDWEQRKIRHLFSIKKEIAGELGHEVISITQRGAKLKDTESGEGQLSMDYSKYQLVKQGDFLMNHMDLLTGYVDVSEFDGVTSPDYRVFVPSSVDVHSPYFLYVFQHCYKSKIFYGYGRGSSHLGRWRFPTVEFEDFYLPVPPTYEQKLIARYLDKKTDQIDRLVEKIQKKIELLKEQRTSIINHYVTKGLDPNVEMKDSGVEWIGDIPKHWEIKKIKHLSMVKRGSSPRPIDDLKYFDEHGIYSWVRIADVSASGKYLETTKEKLSELGSSLSTKMEPGDIFLSIAGTVGKPIITKIKCCIHDGFVWFENLNVNVEFLFYIFLQGTCFQGLGKMGTQLNLNTDTVGDVYVPIPQQDEQSKIVEGIENKLSQIDRFFDLETSRLKRIQEYRQSLISSAVTGKIRITEDMI